MRVFVYGTLKAGFSNSGVMVGSVGHKKAFILGKMYDMSHGAFPGVKLCGEEVLFDASNDRDKDDAKVSLCRNHVRKFVDKADDPPYSWVEGELHTFQNNDSLCALDRLEGFVCGDDSFYQRSLVVVHVKEQEEVFNDVAWVYHLGNPAGKLVESGVWL